MPDKKTLLNEFATECVDNIVNCQDSIIQLNKTLDDTVEVIDKDIQIIKSDLKDILQIIIAREMERLQPKDLVI